MLLIWQYQMPLLLLHQGRPPQYQELGGEQTQQAQLPLTLAQEQQLQNRAQRLLVLTRKHNLKQVLQS